MRRNIYNHFGLVALFLVGNAFCVEVTQGEDAPTHTQSDEQKEANETKLAQKKVNLAILDPRGAPELVVCSQNLKVFGTYGAVKSRFSAITKEDYALHTHALIKRFVRTGCDVIAAQEVLGVNEFEAEEPLQQLADELRKETGRVFDVAVGSSKDKVFHNGFLVARDRATILSSTSYSNVALPKISEKSRSRFFLRSPFEIQLEVKGRGDSPGKNVTLVNIHFKSKAGSSKDPTGLEWETYRMEMAEGLRRVLEKRHAQSFESGEPLLLVVGDRNANFDRASAMVLEGKVTLDNFRKEGNCRVDARGGPACKGVLVRSAQKLFSVLLGDRDTRSSPGTYTYKKQFSWLDDILIPQSGLHFAQELNDSEGNYGSGVVYEPKEASDHALVYVKLNW
jgi:hypothetical protein